MDPAETLRHADRATDNKLYRLALDYLHAYFEWRLKGGFEPPHGDERALSLMRAISDLV